MQINRESNDLNSVQAYSDTEIKVNNVCYHKSLVINAQEIISDWNIRSLTELDEKLSAPLLSTSPKIIIIGHSNPGLLVSPAIMMELFKQGTGLECMSIGAACRTFNVLLSEKREVVLGIIL